jgi:hypothetical protein
MSLIQKLIVMLCISIPLTACQKAPAIDMQQQADLQQEASSIIQQFTKTLKPKLQQALKQGGPAHAISVCSVEAPILAKQLSTKTGWSIKRISLKARSHRTALPDAWETSILQQFDRQQAAGDSPSTMTASHIENGHYRFIKAQDVAPICLTCHGTALSPEVSNALQKYYPQDQATGYTLGQIRGAFSLSKKI